MTVHKTASRVALVVHAVRHAQLIPPDMVSGRLPVSVAAAAVKGAMLLGGGTPPQDSRTSPGDDTADAHLTLSKLEGPKPETALPPVPPSQAPPPVAELQEFADRVEQHRSQVCVDPRHASRVPSMPGRLSLIILTVSALPGIRVLLATALGVSSSRFWCSSAGAENAIFSSCHETFTVRTHLPRPGSGHAGSAMCGSQRAAAGHRGGHRGRPDRQGTRVGRRAVLHLSLRPSQAVYYSHFEH